MLDEHSCHEKASVNNGVYPELVRCFFKINKSSIIVRCYLIIMEFNIYCAVESRSSLSASVTVTSIK